MYSVHTTVTTITTTATATTAVTAEDCCREVNLSAFGALCVTHTTHTHPHEHIQHRREYPL